MNDEIKEILDYFRKYATIRENTMISEIEDYITNLQQEIERQSKAQVILDDMLADYKSRIDKAVEYLDKVETLAMIDGKIIFSINIFKNILQNGGDDNG